MKLISAGSRRLLLAAVLGWLVSWAGDQGAVAAPAAAATNEIRIVELQGTAEIFLVGATRWALTQTNQTLNPHDRLRTGPNSRIVLRWADQSIATFGALTELEIRPPHEPKAESGLHLWKGLLSFFHRDEPGRIRLSTRGVRSGIKGTEFVMQVETVNGTERTTFSLIDGVAEFGNDRGMITLTNGQQATAEEGQAPVRTAGFIANNVLQWCLYYPAVLDLRDLPLTPEELGSLHESLAAYRAGDLLAALHAYPADRQPGSAAERIYHAALLLSVGQVKEMEDELSRLPAAEPTERFPRLANALRQLIAAVKREPNPSTLTPQLSSELLAASYFEQSRGVREDSLEAALQMAWQAATNSPEFGFAWARVAELEFSFGRTSHALDALTKSRTLAPRNAQALALNGFLFAAQNRIGAAIAKFNEAIAVDAALGNAWLGRGLCRIRRGDRSGGREDLLIAAALEPQRALLRSYLGKAYADEGDRKRARHELDLAKGLDQDDPTAWLYSALLDEQENRINESIRDLEKSQELNDNRSVYRSQLLLDQDRAVRSANLARIYDEAGMSDVAVREAGRAVTADYANYSAHAFLANSYDGLRRASSVDLRYETPAYSEYLIATLLGPPVGSALAQPVSQQQYTSLLDRDGLGIFSSTEYLSRGAWSEYGAQYGTFGGMSYALEGSYLTDPGELPNQDVETRMLSAKFRQAITPNDFLLLEVQDFKSSGGDLVRVYDPAEINQTLRFKETQSPNLLLGYQHEWSPGQHTLLLAGRFNDTYQSSAMSLPSSVTLRLGGEIAGIAPMGIDTEYQSRQDIYSVEVQQLSQNPRHTLIAGARAQWGTTSLNNYQSNPSGGIEPLFPQYPLPVVVQDFNSHFNRFSLYAYDYWRVVGPLTLVGGIAYDYLTLPRNENAPPLDPTTESQQQVSPKVGFIWTPADWTTVRGAYTRSLGGFNLDQSVRLEPTQVAGFVQTYRSLIPESLAGALAGATFDTFDLSWELKLAARTYFALEGQLLYSSLEHDVGAFVNDDFTAEASVPWQLRQKLDFREQSLGASLHQVVGRDLTLGIAYRLSQARLEYAYPDLPESACSPDFPCAYTREGLLQSLLLRATYNHPSGFFGQISGRWVAQDNLAADSAKADANFWQLDLLAGYRFCHRRAEVALGLLNVTDQDYRLNPVNLYAQLARSRTLAVRFQFKF